MNLIPEIYIVSAYNKGNDKEDNNRLHDSLKLELLKKGLVVKDCLGKFNGTEEKSLMVMIDRYNTANTFTQDDLLDLMTISYNQECIFYRGSDRHSLLIYKDKETPIGVTRCYHETQLTTLPSDNYTYFPLTHTYLF